MTTRGMNDTTTTVHLLSLCNDYDDDDDGTTTTMLRKRHSESHSSLHTIITTTTTMSLLSSSSSLSVMTRNNNGRDDDDIIDCDGKSAKQHPSNGIGIGIGIGGLRSRLSSSGLSGLSNHHRRRHYRRSSSAGNVGALMSSSSSSSSSILPMSTCTKDGGGGRRGTHRSSATIMAAAAAHALLVDALHIDYFAARVECLSSKIAKYNDVATIRCPPYGRAFHRVRPHAYSWLASLHTVFIDVTKLLSIIARELRFTRTQTAMLVVFYASYYVWYVRCVEMPHREIDLEWQVWEKSMRDSVSDMMPPSLPPSGDDASGGRPPRESSSYSYSSMSSPRIGWDHRTTTTVGRGGWPVDPFPHPRNRSSDGASDYAVPVPDYESMGRTRETLATRLTEIAVRSCEDYRRPRMQRRRRRLRHRMPVIGITVANDTPGNRYLRRLLHTIDADAVGSIVVTWYDERTESQIVRGDSGGGGSPSHDVVESALDEFIDRRGYVEMSWDDRDDEGARARPRPRDGGFGGNGVAEGRGGGGGGGRGGDDDHPLVRLADSESLELMSRMATVRQFCILDDDERNRNDSDYDLPRNDDNRNACVNELVVLRFATNLGFSTGVNNALLVHPHAPHWLIANYDIAYPPTVLDVMGKELERARDAHPDLAVHTYGYIYGRGKLENPWSNFVMTSCAVARVGVWDENIFPAYYEDDDYRDRIRYVLGEWRDVIGDPDAHDDGDAPLQYMNDAHLIRYMTGRNVSVAHGPLDANTYLSGTHETMKKVHDEEEAIEREESSLPRRVRSWISRLLLRAVRGGVGGRRSEDHPRPDDHHRNPLHYESLRWSTAQEVSDARGYFRCKHGGLPDAGEHGEDPLRYFGWHERFLVPFVNRTRVTRLREYYMSRRLLNETAYVVYARMKRDRRGRTRDGDADTAAADPSPWAAWMFNATRRRCVHEAVNALLSMPPSEERANLTRQFRDSCSVC